MFQNSFQNGNYFELFDPKSILNNYKYWYIVAVDKVKNLYKTTSSSNIKVFDKDLKSIIYYNK